MSNNVGPRRFQYLDEKSSKFWEINIAGNCLTVRYGAIGTDGEMQTNEYSDAATAEKQAQKLISEKTINGYQEVGKKSGLGPEALLPVSSCAGKFHHSKEIAEYTPGLGKITPRKYSYVIQVGDTVDVFKKIFCLAFEKGKVIEIIDHVGPVLERLRRFEEFGDFEEDESEVISQLYPLWGQRDSDCYLNNNARSCIVEIRKNVSITALVASRIHKRYPDIDVRALTKPGIDLFQFDLEGLNVKLKRIKKNHFSAILLVRSLLDADSVVSTKEIEEYNQKFIESKVVENVAWSDEIIPRDMLDALNAEVDVMCNKERKDYHPGSDKAVRDIVHPSLYCYVKGVSKVIKSPSSGYVKPKKTSDLPLGATDFWGRSYEDSNYQWLPAEFVVDDNGNVLINSYINNLDKDKYPRAYDMIARIFGVFVPMFESVCGALRNDFYDEEKSSEEISIPLRNRKLQVVTKLVEYRVTKEENFDGVWHVEGMSHENILVTGLCILKRDETFTGAEISFKRYLFQQEGDDLIGSTPQNANRPTETMDGGDVRPLGTLSTPYGRAIVFPNSHIHKLSNMSSSDGKTSVRRILVFWLVNPDSPIVSTANVAKQQDTMAFEDAKKYQLALMNERKLHKESFNTREVYLCEH